MQRNVPIRRFTIIELLVVIAIMGVLAAMLWPVIEGVRDKAAKTNAATYEKTLRSDPGTWRFYTFDEGSGTTLKNLAAGQADDVMFDATLLNGTCADGGRAPTWVEDGGRFLGKHSLQFDGGNDYVLLEGAWKYREKWEACTVAGWVKSSSTQRQVIVTFDRSEAWRLSLRDDQLDRLAGWDTTEPDTTIHDMGVDSAASTPEHFKNLTDGKWHLIVGTYDAADPERTKRLYIDGLEVPAMHLETAGGSGGVDDPHDGNPLRSDATDSRYGHIGVGSENSIGDTSGDNAHLGPDAYFRGFIDQVLIMRRAMTPGEVMEYYNSTKP